MVASTINYLAPVEFGAGAVSRLDAALASLNIVRPMIVSDRGLEASGLLSRLDTLLPDGVPRFLDVPTNPTETAALAALDLYRRAGCDGIVAFGGGSPIDLAKAVALLATHDQPLSQYAMILGGLERIGKDLAPVIAIPTTAGTGAEVGRAALITLDDGRKLGLVSPNLIPRRVLCDPELTVGMPAWLTAATGFDALSHCIETLYSPRFNPPAEAIALDGAGRLWRSLARAVSAGDDVAARAEMMMGALEGGLAFQKGLGAVHSLSHALGALSGLKLHHGTLNAILMPSVLRFNESVAEAKAARLRIALGLPNHADLAAALEELRDRCGLPARLGPLGVTVDMLPGVIENAMLDHSHATNPRLPSAEDYRDLLLGVL